MTIWLDAQLSPKLARWLSTEFSVDAVAVRDVGLLHALDLQIFMAARAAGAVVVTKDLDFVRLLERHGPPPQVVWVTCGNTSNARLAHLLKDAWPSVLAMLQAGERMIEISDRPANPSRQ